MSLTFMAYITGGMVVLCAELKKRNTGYLNEDHMCFTWGVWEW